MAKKIGFRQYDDAEKEEKKKQSMAMAEFLKQKYSPIGATADKCYKTIDELVYELDNIVSVTRNELAMQLSLAGFKTEFIAGVPYWVLYEKNY